MLSVCLPNTHAFIHAAPLSLPTARTLVPSTVSRNPFLHHRTPRSRRARIIVACENLDQPENLNPNNNHDDDDAPDPASERLAEVLFNHEVLRRRISDLENQKNSSSSTSDHVLDLIASEDSDDISVENAEALISQFESLAKVWVIVFTNTASGCEGVYSLSIADESIVLAFQEREDAHRYAICLEAQMFPEPQLCEMDSTELSEFCSESGFRLGFVPKGMPITPPDESAVDDLDKWRGKPTSDSNGTGMSEDDIDAMRKRFDSLFGQ